MLRTSSYERLLREKAEAEETVRRQADIIVLLKNEKALERHGKPD